MTTIGEEEEKHKNLTCVDIIKDAIGANLTQINNARTSRNVCSIWSDERVLGWNFT